MALHQTKEFLHIKGNCTANFTNKMKRQPTFKASYVLSVYTVGKYKIVYNQEN